MDEKQKSVPYTLPMKVADLSAEEFEAIIRRAVNTALAEHGQSHLDLREEFVEELQSALADHGTDVSLDEAVRRLGLDDDAAEEPGLDAYWEAELRRQDEEIRAGTARLVPFEEAMARMLRPLD
jgi:hypothetical protein